jgi:hypothetical protein
MADRTLCYSDTFTQYIEGEITEDTTGDSINNEVVLSSERQPLVLMLTADEYLDMFSALLLGTDLLWGSVGQQIQWNLWKAAKMENQFCTSMIACLESETSGVSSAFADWLIGQIQNNSEVQNVLDGSGGDQSTPVEANSTKLGAECDLDLLFGFTKQLTQMMNSVVVDFYQKLEEKSNFLEALPIISQEVSAFSYFVEWVEFLLNSVRDAYLSNYDLAYENEIACELFCLAQDNPDCSLTWYEVTNYFAGRIGATSALETLSDLLVFLVAGSWSGTQFCDLSLMAFAFIMRIGAEWSGIDLNALQLIVNSFFNDPDSDWMTLCDCGYVFFYEYDQAYQNGFNPTQGQWATSTALYSTDASPYGITIEQTYGSPFDGLQKVELYTLKSGESPVVTLDITHSGGTVQIGKTVLNGAWVVWDLPSTLDGVSYIKFHTTTHVGLSVAYDHIRLSGIGDNPPPDPVNPP